MQINNWKNEVMQMVKKKPIPVLSFPSIQIMNTTVRELVYDSDLQAQGMKAIADRCDTLAAVSMMDLSVEAEAFGSKIRVDETEVPTVIGAILNEPEDADALAIPEVGAGRTGLYINAIAKAVKLISDRPVFAGVIGPFSLAGRLMGISDIMINCYEEPEMVTTTVEKCTAFIKDYILAYKAVGAAGVVIAEPVAGVLSPAMMEEFSGRFLKKLVADVQDDSFGVIYHNCGNATKLMLPQIADIGAIAYHFGDAVDMEEICKGMPSDSLVMGNVSPAKTLRGGTPETVRAETLSILEKCSKYPNFVISSGCDIPPDTKWENIDAFFAAVDEFYSR